MDSCRRFEETFESSQWREAKKYIQCYFTPIKAGDLKIHSGEKPNVTKCNQYEFMRLEETFESSQWREAKKYIRCYFTPIKAGDLKIPPLQYKFRRETFNEDTF